MDIRIKSSLNLLYSLSMILYFFGNTFLSTYVTEDIGFRWGRLYIIVTILILVIIILRKISMGKLQNIIGDKYLFMMMLIFSWETLSSLFSIQTVLSIKKTILVFLVFLVFYLIPKYSFKDNEKNNFMIFLLYPLNILITFISSINLLDFLKILKINDYIPFWTTNATIYENPNTFGVRIMLILMTMNVYLVIDERFRDKLKKNIILKSYTLFSYSILIINLILSSSRASLLGVVIAFMPIMYKYRKKVLLVLIPISYFIWGKRENLFLLKKISKGTSGRSEMWKYAIKEVISEHPIAGVGSGAFQDYVGHIFQLRQMHNSYLEEIMANGLVGLMLWTIVLIFAFKKTFMLGNEKYIFIFTILGFMAYSFFEIGLFGELGLNMSMFWVFVMLAENKLST